MFEIRKMVARVLVAFCGILALLLVIDLFWPNANLFLKPLTKVFLLITCLLGAFFSVTQLALQRREVRRRMPVRGYRPAPPARRPEHIPVPSVHPPRAHSDYEPDYTRRRQGR